MLRRDIGIGDSRRFPDGGVGPHGRRIDDEAALGDRFTRQVVVSVVAFRRVARYQCERNPAFGQCVLHGLRGAPRAEHQRLRRFGPAQQAVECGAQSGDVGIVALQRSVPQAADAVHRADGLRLGSDAVQQMHDTAFVGDRDVQSAQLRHRSQQRRQLFDGRKFVKRIFAVR